MADYRGGFNSNATDGGQSSRGAVAGFRGNSYRGGGIYVQKESDVAGHSGCNRGGYAQPDNNSGSVESFRGGRGGYVPRDESESCSINYRGILPRGYGQISVGNRSDNCCRGAYRGNVEGQSYRGNVEGYRGSVTNFRGGFNRGNGSQVDVTEQSGGYRSGGRRGYQSQDYPENRDATTAGAASAYQPTSEEKAGLAEWDSSIITKPLAFTSLKKTFVVAEAHPKPSVIQQILQKKFYESPVEDARVEGAQEKIDGAVSISLSEKPVNQDKSDGEGVAQQPPVSKGVSTNIEIDKERGKKPELKKPEEVLNVIVETVAEVVTVVESVGKILDANSVPITVDHDLRSPILSADKLKTSVNVRESEVGTSSAGLMHTFSKSDLKQFAEISGMFRDAFSKLQELISQML